MTYFSDNIECPTCHYSTLVKDMTEGETGNCHHCGAGFIIDSFGQDHDWLFPTWEERLNKPVEQKTTMPVVYECFDCAGGPCEFSPKGRAIKDNIFPVQCPFDENGIASAVFVLKSPGNPVVKECSTCWQQIVMGHEIKCGKETPCADKKEWAEKTTFKTPAP